MSNQNDYRWVDIFVQIRDAMCGRCDIRQCQQEHKLRCYENFLWIASEVVKKNSDIADKHEVTSRCYVNNNNKMCT